MEITADGFLYNMVRSIMGTLINVGRHKWKKEEIARILTAQNRSVAGSTAPACGSYLVEVWNRWHGLRWGDRRYLVEKSLRRLTPSLRRGRVNLRFLF